MNPDPYAYLNIAGFFSSAVAKMCYGGQPTLYGGPRVLNTSINNCWDMSGSGIYDCSDKMKPLLCDADKCEIEDTAKCPRVCKSTCKADQKCFKGLCLDCLDDTDCVTGICNTDHKCAVLCDNSKNCPAGQYCDDSLFANIFGNKKCVQGNCSTDSDCATGQYCKDNAICTNNFCVNISMGMLGCGEYHTCEGATCIPNVQPPPSCATGNCPACDNFCDPQQCMKEVNGQCINSCQHKEICRLNPGAPEGMCSEVCGPCETFIPDQGCVSDCKEGQECGPKINNLFTQALEVGCVPKCPQGYKYNPLVNYDIMAKEHGACIKTVQKCADYAWTPSNRSYIKGSGWPTNYQPCSTLLPFQVNLIAQGKEIFSSTTSAATDKWACVADKDGNESSVYYKASYDANGVIVYTEQSSTACICGTCNPEKTNQCQFDPTIPENANLNFPIILSESTTTALTCSADPAKEGKLCEDPSETIFDKIKDLVYSTNPACPLCDKFNSPSVHTCKAGQCAPTPIIEASCPKTTEPKVCAIETQEIIDDSAVISNLRLEELKKDFANEKFNVSSQSQLILWALGFAVPAPPPDANGNPPILTNQELKYYLEMVQLWMLSSSYGGGASDFNTLIDYDNTSYFPGQILPQIVNLYQQKWNQLGTWPNYEMEASYLMAQNELIVYYQDLLERNDTARIGGADTFEIENRKETLYNSIDTIYDGMLTYVPQFQVNKYDKAQMWLARANTQLLRYAHFRDYDAVINQEAGNITSVNVALYNQENRIKSLAQVLQYQAKAVDVVTTVDEKAYNKMLLRKSKASILNQMISAMDNSIVKAKATYDARFPDGSPSYITLTESPDTQMNKDSLYFIADFAAYWAETGPIARAANSAIYNTATAEELKQDNAKKKDLAGRRISAFATLKFILNQGTDLDEYFNSNELKKLELIKDAIKSDLSYTDLVATHNDISYLVGKDQHLEEEYKMIYLLACNINEVRNSALGDLTLLVENGNPTFFQGRFKFPGKEKVVNASGVAEPVIYGTYAEYPYEFETTLETIAIEYQLSQNILSDLNTLIMTYATIATGGQASMLWSAGKYMKAAQTAAKFAETLAGWHAFSQYTSIYDPHGTLGDLAGIGIVGWHAGKTSIDLINGMKAITSPVSKKIAYSRYFENEQKFNDWLAEMGQKGYQVNTNADNVLEISGNGINNVEFFERIGLEFPEPDAGVRVDVGKIFDIVDCLSKPAVPVESPNLLAKPESKMLFADFVKNRYETTAAGSLLQKRAMKEVIAPLTWNKMVNDIGNPLSFGILDPISGPHNGKPLFALSIINESPLQALIQNKTGLKTGECGRFASSAPERQTKPCEMRTLFIEVLSAAQKLGIKKGVINAKFEHIDAWIKILGKKNTTNGKDIVLADPIFMNQNDIHLGRVEGDKFYPDGCNLFQFVTLPDGTKVPLEYGVLIFDVDGALIYQKAKMGVTPQNPVRYHRVSDTF